MNLPSYGAGMAFHAGVVTALGAGADGARSAWSCPRSCCSRRALLTLAGAVGGFGLLAEAVRQARAAGPVLPGRLRVQLPQFPVRPAGLRLDLQPRPADGLWLAEAVLLLVYAPLGKIRHCLFFFTTRYQLGAFFGRRGTFPPAGASMPELDELEARLEASRKRTSSAAWRCSAAS